jgi:hypothetical protein
VDFVWYPSQICPQKVGADKGDQGRRKFTGTARITEPHVEPPRPEGWKPLVLTPQLVQLSDEGIRKLADERMREWSKYQEEFTEKQFQDTQKRKEVSSNREVSRKVPPIQEIEKEAEVRNQAEVERAEAIKRKYSEQLFKLGREISAVEDALDQAERVERNPGGWGMSTEAAERSIRELRQKSQSLRETRERLRSRIQEEIEGKIELEDPFKIQAEIKAKKAAEMAEWARVSYEKEIVRLRKSIANFEEGKARLQAEFAQKQKARDQAEEEFKLKFSGPMKKGEGQARGKLQSNIKMYSAHMEQIGQQIEEAERRIQGFILGITQEEELLEGRLALAKEMLIQKNETVG